MAKVFIDGEAGTTGLQIAQRLGERQDLELLHLGDDERKDPVRRAAMLCDADVAILCLPDAAAREAVAMLGDDGRIIDASTAHRTAPGWVYGFPEYEREQAERIAGASRVSNPGCYAVAAVSILHPLRLAGLLPDDHPVVIHGVSGYTGGGKSLIRAFEDPSAPDAITSNHYLYKLDLGHKHVPEIQVHAPLARRPIFVPSVGRFAQGMIVEVPLHLWALPSSTKRAEIHATLADHYASVPCGRTVTVAPLDESARVAERLDAQAMVGTDAMMLHVFGDEAEEQVLVCAVLDNLGKGAAGQAVQNLDLMLGRYA